MSRARIFLRLSNIVGLSPALSNVERMKAQFPENASQAAPSSTYGRAARTAESGEMDLKDHAFWPRTGDSLVKASNGLGPRNAAGDRVLPVTPASASLIDRGQRR